jgi:hypothetical protein
VADSPHFPDEQVTVQQLADALGLSKWTVHWHIREGHIPANRIPMPGSKIYIVTVDRDKAEQIVAEYQRYKRWTKFE